METGFTDPSNKSGFTINMAHYVKRAREIRNGFIINGNSYLRLRVDSDYNLGYVFGSFLSKGISNLSNHRGQVVFRLYKNEDLLTLCKSFKESFNVTAKVRLLENNKVEVVVYSKPIARLLSEFGNGKNRKLPDKYLVHNTGYLLGIKEGINHFRGLEVDDRDVLRKREFSYSVKSLYEYILTTEAS